jgi:vitamin B12 transporter
MKKTILASLVGLAFAPSVYSAENIELDDVVITASRVEQPRESVVADVTVINREEIERAGSDSLTDILRRQPGVQISANGGAGTASNIYLRGTNSDHLIVLVDGLRINSVTLGTTAFESIPLSQIEKIEIVRGPASSLYGADAIGGVIQIFTRKSNSSTPQVYAAAGLGSYNTKNADAGISGGYNKLKYSLNVSSLDTDGFSARRVRAGKFDKDDDGHYKLSVSANTELLLTEGHSLGLQYFESKNRSDYDGGSDNFDNYGRQTLQSYAFTSKNQFSSFWHSTFKFGLGVDRSDSHVLPSAFSAPGGVSKFRSEQKQLTWQNDLSLPLGLLTLAYDRLEQKVDSTTNYAKDARNTDGFLASYLLNHDKHTIQASVREDHNSQYGNYTTGGVGYGYRFTPAWRVSTNYGKAFKAPTFNQLFFPNFGDPALEPEKSENIDIAINYEGNHFNSGITLFQNNIRNLIANSGPAAGTCTSGGFCPVNVGKVEIQGITFNGQWDITNDLLLSGNYTVQSPRDDETDQLLVRRSNRYGAINLLHRIADLQWGAEISGASTRYNNTDNTKKMSGYMLLNLTANYKLNPEWKLEARANNILDKEYVLAYTGNTDTSPAYNTAGSNLFVGLRYDMKP